MVKRVNPNWSKLLNLIRGGSWLGRHNLHVWILASSLLVYHEVSNMFPSYAMVFHYQKTDKYKRKYRGNYGGIKKLKQSKKNNDVSGFTNGITDGIYSIGKSVGKLVYTVHHVNYKGNHWRTKSVGIFQRAPELFTFQLHC